MTIGDKIKIIREFRGMTKKDLGLAINFPENQAVKRIMEYERNEKIPKDDIVNKLIKAFQISPYALLKTSDNKSIDIIEEIFWFEETMNQKIVFNDLFKTYVDIEMVQEGADPKNTTPYQASKYSLTGVPEDDFIYTSIQMKNFLLRKTKDKELSREAYLYWKLCWPYNIQIHDYFRLYNNKSFSNEPMNSDREFCRLSTQTEEFAKKEFDLISIDYEIPFLPIAKGRLNELKTFYTDLSDFEDTKTINPLDKLAKLLKDNTYVAPPRNY